MKHIKIEAFNCEDAWWKTLYNIFTQGETFDVKVGSELTETKKLDITLIIKHPEVRPLISDKMPNDMIYVQNYALEYLWVDNKDDSTYTYGERINFCNQKTKIIERLKKEPNDRQCTIVIRHPSDLNINDPPCLSLMDFEVLENKLNTTCYFRSWDAYGGLPTNVAGLQLFNEALAKEIGVESGMLIFHSKNCHIYRRQYFLIEKLFQHENKNSFFY